jgi:hypothetical protein
MCKNGDIIHFEIEKQPKLMIKQFIYANIIVVIYLFHDRSYQKSTTNERMWDILHFDIEEQLKLIIKFGRPYPCLGFKFPCYNFDK